MRFFQRTEKRFRDITNCGQVVGYRNRAKGERWEAAAFGLDAPSVPEGTSAAVDRLLGVMLVRGGNHLLVVGVAGRQVDPALLSRGARTSPGVVVPLASDMVWLPADIDTFTANLGGENGRCKFLGLEALDFENRGTLRDIWSFSLRQD